MNELPASEDMDLTEADFATDGFSRSDLLREALLKVVERHDPEVAPIIRGERALVENAGASGKGTGASEAAALGTRVLARTIQAEAIWFQLLAIAEQNRDMRRRRVIERERGRDHVPGTFEMVLSNARDAGVTAAQVREAFANLRIRPTITAHPTEAKRVSVLERHRRIYLRLLDFESNRWTDRERDDVERAIHDEVELLWLTGELKLEKPTVEQEVAWGLYFFNENLFDVVPQLYARVEEAFARVFPGEAPLELPTFFSFGSWIGGDRDGNPYVTSEVTRRTLWQTRLTMLRRYRQRAHELIRLLSISDLTKPVSDAFRQALKTRLESVPQGDAIAKRNPNEPVRQWLGTMLSRMDATIAANERESGGNALAVAAPDKAGAIDTLNYENADQLLADIDAMIDAMRETGMERMASATLVPFRREVSIFRFSGLRLDVRENTIRTTAALAAMYRALNGGRDAPAVDSPEWKAWLLKELAAPKRNQAERDASFVGMPEECRETLHTFRTIAQMRDQIDREAFGALILSMTHSAADVLGVYLLAKEGGLFSGVESTERCTLPVVPLLETIPDLRAAPAILSELMKVPLVERSLRGHRQVQEVMVGYSDSNKDGGYFAANWELNKAQAGLTRLGKENGVAIAFFHGRGGSVSRGGVPTGRGISAAPAGSINRQFRTTEQGEVVSLKYANRGTAAYQVELLSSSVIEHILMSERNARDLPTHEFDEAMEAISGTSWTAYRNLMTKPELFPYLQASSPLDELAMLNMGSRPARRTAARTMEDLRAIPWVFSWTQNRHMLPGWYGVGSGLQAFLDVRKERGRDTLKRMFRQSRLFRLVIDEVEKTLLTVDLDIARAFAELVPDASIRDAIFPQIEREYHLTSELVCSISGGKEVAERFPQYRRRLERRLETMNQVSRQQVQLLRAVRNGGGDEVTRALLLSINCAAAGIGATG